MSTYESFLLDKVRFDDTYGHEVADVDLNPILKPHQRDIVRWAVKGGRRAIFAAFGLGKSVMQLETLRLILDRDGLSRTCSFAGVDAPLKGNPETHPWGVGLRGDVRRP